MQHGARRSTLVGAARMSQQPSASRRGDDQFKLSAPVHSKADTVAFQASRDPSNQLPDQWTASRSCSASPGSDGACTVREDRMLEKAVEEWHQLCQRLQDPETL